MYPWIWQIYQRAKNQARNRYIMMYSYIVEVYNLHTFTVLFQNACFYHNRTLLNKVKELAARRDVNAIEEISHSEVCYFGF